MLRRFGYVISPISYIIEYKDRIKSLKYDINYLQENGVINLHIIDKFRQDMMAAYTGDFELCMSPEFWMMLAKLDVFRFRHVAHSHNIKVLSTLFLFDMKIVVDPQIKGWYIHGTTEKKM